MDHERKRPKASRMERQVRNLNRGLWVVSIVLLAVCMAMTGVYGWSLGATLVSAAILSGGMAALDKINTGRAGGMGQTWTVTNHIYGQRDPEATAVATVQKMKAKAFLKTGAR